MADREGETKQGLGKKGIVFIAAGIVLIIILLIVIAVLLLRGREQKTEEPKRNVVVNQSNAEEIASEMISQEYIEPGYYSVSMTTTWHFETGNVASYDAYVENLVENTNDVYFDVFFEGQEEEPIYQSPVIPRGSELEEIVLDKSLDAGTYSCVMVYHLVDAEQNTVSTLRVAFTIVVEN